MKEAPQKGAVKGEHVALIAPTNYAETMDAEEYVESVLPVSPVPRKGHVPLHQKGLPVEAKTSRPLTPLKWKLELAAPPSFRWRKPGANMVTILQPCSSWG